MSQEMSYDVLDNATRQTSPGALLTTLPMRGHADPIPRFDYKSGNRVQSHHEPRKRRILCLDGGGIRGISSLLILQRLMERVRDCHSLSETPKPCEYFDVIGGTSTGGIVAIMLGRLGMTVAQSLKAYTRMAERAFTPSPTWNFPFIFLPSSKGKFSADSLKEAIQDIVEEHTGDRGSLFSDPTCCSTVVLAVTKANVGGPPTKFKSYNIGDDFRECTIWEVARATSAALTFFPPISCGRQQIEFMDAGFGHNNPTEVLLGETYENVFPGEDVSCILSIGTGLNGVIAVKDGWIDILKALKDMATNSQAVHRSLDARYGEDVYFRFDVTQGLDDVTLSDWKESSTISAHTINYLENSSVNRSILRCAKVISQAQACIKPCEPNSSNSARVAKTSRAGIEKSTRKPRNAKCCSEKLMEYLCKTFETEIPAAVPLLTVAFHDPVGGRHDINLDYILSMKMFLLFVEAKVSAALDCKYRDSGSFKIRNGEFFLRHPDTNRIVDIRQPWSTIMRPGELLSMSIRFENRKTSSHCPNCGHKELSNSVTVTCHGPNWLSSECGVVFDRFVRNEIDNSPQNSTEHSRNIFQNTSSGKLDDLHLVSDEDLIHCFRQISLVTTKPGKTSKMLNCNTMWDRMQSCPQFKDGEFDLDLFCKDLQKKAKCSETGAVVNEDDFSEIMRKYTNGS